jgi:hypothetical protein
MSDYSDTLSVCLIDSRVFVGDTLSRVFVGDPVSRVLHGRRPGGPSPGGGTVEREISDSDMVGGEREGGATSKRGGVSQRSPRPELDEAEYLCGEKPRGWTPSVVIDWGRSRYQHHQTESRFRMVGLSVTPARKPPRGYRDRS